MRYIVVAFLCVLVSGVVGCNSQTSTVSQNGTNQESPVEHLRSHVSTLQAKAEHTDSTVKVQHILIAFQGTLPGKPITRTKDEAEALVADLLKKIEGGADFAGLVKEHSDDSPVGIYTMTTPGQSVPGAMPRNRMVPAFGNVGWRLQVGEVGVAPFDKQASPYGWHIVKRLE